MTWKKILNSTTSLDSCIELLNGVFETRVSAGGELFEVIVKPYQHPKTYDQIKGIHVLLKQLEETNENQWMGHSADWWKRYYKLHSYIPLLKIEALERGDEETIELIQSAHDMVKAAQGAAVFECNIPNIIFAYNRFIKANKGRGDLDRMAEAFIFTVNKHDVGELTDYRIADFIADNPAFSLAHASKANLINMIDFMMKDAAHKGIHLVLEKTEEAR